MSNALRRHENTSPMLALEELDRRWTHFIGEIAAGVKLAAALESAQMTRAMYESLTRSNPSYLQAYQDAQLAWMRSMWSDENVDEVLMRIARGDSVESACAAVGRDRDTWLKLVLKVPELYVRYQDAMRMKALTMQDDILEIADDTDGDLERIENERGTVLKGNNAAVKRAELRVDTRRFLMESWLPKVFGRDAARLEATLNVEINHVEQLEEARQRRDRGVKITPRERAEAIEGEIVAAAPVPTEERTQTIDYAKAVSWLE